MYSIKSVLVGFITLGLIGCQSVNPTKVYLSQLKYEHQWQVLSKAIWEAKMASDAQLKTIKKYAKSQNNSDASLQKILNAEYLKKETMYLISDVDRLLYMFEQGTYSESLLTTKEFFDKKSQGLSKLIKRFDEYALSLQKKLVKYTPDTTSWSRRYLKLYPPSERQQAPDFKTFYFKGVSKYQVLLALGTLELAILQEEIAIQKKILKE